MYICVSDMYLETRTHALVSAQLPDNATRLVFFMKTVEDPKAPSLSSSPNSSEACATIFNLGSVLIATDVVEVDHCRIPHHKPLKEGRSSNKIPLLHTSQHRTLPLTSAICNAATSCILSPHNLRARSPRLKSEKKCGTKPSDHPLKLALALTTEPRSHM